MLTIEEADDKQQRYDRFVERAEIPMLSLSLLLIPVLVMPVVEDLSDESRRALQSLSAAIWVGFVVEYFLLIGLAPNRREAISTHKLDLALVLLPFLRPLRMARLARLAQAGTAAARVVVAVGRLVGRPGFTAIIGTVGGFIVVGGGLVAIAEHGQPGSTISNFGDGLWWAFVTCTTVGYGDTFPVTTTGRVIATLLMLAGISGLSAITANIAAYFVSADSEDDSDELAERLARIESQLEHIASQLPQRSDEASS